MKKPLTLLPLRWIAIALLALAVWFRFTGLDSKVYWHDEAYTSMAITARPSKYFYDPLFQNCIVTARDLLDYAMYVLCRTAPRNIRLFILSTALMLGLPDLLAGGQRLTVPRYPIACYVAL
jgi:uncharacterized membrane protein